MVRRAQESKRKQRIRLGWGQEEPSGAGWVCGTIKRGSLPYGKNKPKSTPGVLAQMRGLGRNWKHQALGGIGESEHVKYNPQKGGGDAGEARDYKKSQTQEAQTWGNCEDGDGAPGGVRKESKEIISEAKAEAHTHWLVFSHLRL